MYCTRVVHFSIRHACMTFWTHRWPATGNSEPDSPYQPACARSVTSGLRSVRLCMASASWCWINGWNVRQKLNICLLRCHVHTKVTWSSWLPFMILFSFEHDVAHTFWRPCNNERLAAHATAARAHDSKHQSNHRRTKPAAGSQINVSL